MERELRQLVDDSRVDAAVDQRRQRRLQLEVAAADATFRAALADLADAGADVAVVSRSGRRYTGRIAGVWRGVVVLRRRGSTVLLRQVAAVSGPELPVPTSTRAPDHRTLAEELALVGTPGTSVELVAAGAAWAGEVLAVGADVVTVRLPGAEVAYVSTEAVDDAVLRSG